MDTLAEEEGINDLQILGSAQVDQSMAVVVGGGVDEHRPDDWPRDGSRVSCESIALASVSTITISWGRALPTVLCSCS